MTNVPEPNPALCHSERNEVQRRISNVTFFNNVTVEILHFVQNDRKGGSG
jgi:hypothetical protein